MDVFGQALRDYQNGSYTEDIITYSSLDEKDTLPLPYLFRGFEAMPSLEQKALERCHGHILDIGCGAGSHSLYLQKKGLRVTALDISLGAITTSRARGIKNTIHTSILDYNTQRFDTLLLLMNGIGVAGKLSLLQPFLSHLKTLLKPGGQILLDSSDIIYMFDKDEDGGYWIPDTNAYYGEVTFAMAYRKKKGKPFPWLYLDFNTLQNSAWDCDLNCELVIEGEHYDYLARLSCT